MALPVLDPTPGGASANTYATLAEGNAYFEVRPGSEVWQDAGTDERTKGLLFAVVLIDREIYYDRKFSAGQALKFPRSNQSDSDGDPIIFTDIKHAQFEQALDLMKGEYFDRLEFLEQKQMGVRQITTDETQVRMIPSWPENMPVYALAPTARQLLLPYIESTVRLGRA